MARRISTGIQGKNVLGALSTTDNTISSVIEDEDIILDPSGQGDVLVESNVFIQDQNMLKLGDSDASHWVGLRAPATVSSDVTLTFPATAGTSGYVLTTNGSGTLSWENVAVGIGDDISTDGVTTYYPTLTSTTSGGITELKIVSSKFTYNANTGTLTTTAFNETSSIALKENVAPIENALDKILQLVGVTYDRKDGSSTNEAGLIAEEVNEILPNLVSKDEDGNPYAISYSKFSAYLIEAVKELAAEVQRLKR